MGETRVDLLHLLEDLRDAYPESLEETILTEIVANSLDSGATQITLSTDSSTATLTVTDDGSGMRRRELARYHDIASSGKTRGQGIGFAGVGIKLGLLASEEVVTETMRGKSHVATRWHLATRHRAPWKWIPPAGLLGRPGTAVRLKLRNPLSPLLDRGFLESALRSRFRPILSVGFEEALERHYPAGVIFSLEGATVEKETWSADDVSRLALRIGRARRPSAVGQIWRDRSPLPDDRRGLAISTFGKVIKRGWDWLGVLPAAPDRVGGLIEVPALAECLTLSKSDFIRTGSKGAIYLAFRKAIQEAVAAELERWGDGLDGKQRRHRSARPMERDLAAVLGRLCREYPLLDSLVQKRSGGQRRLPVGDGEGRGVGNPAAAVITAVPPPPEGANPRDDPHPPQAGERPSEERRIRVPPPLDTALPGRHSRTKAGHYGLNLQFEARPETLELGRLVESTVWINEAHPAYRRAVASRSEGYHVAVAVATAFAAVAIEPMHQHGFLIAFLNRWGETLERTTRAGEPAKPRRAGSSARP